MKKKHVTLILYCTFLYVYLILFFIFVLVLSIVILKRLALWLVFDLKESHSLLSPEAQSNPRTCVFWKGFCLVWVYCWSMVFDVKAFPLFAARPQVIFIWCVIQRIKLLCFMSKCWSLEWFDHCCRVSPLWKLKFSVNSMPWMLFYQDAIFCILNHAHSAINARSNFVISSYFWAMLFVLFILFVLIVLCA